MPLLISLSKREGSAASRNHLFIIFLLLAPTVLASLLLLPRGNSPLALSATRAAAAADSAKSAHETARAIEAYGKLPLRFEANRGQTDGAVSFISRGNGYTLFLTPAGAVLRLRDPAEQSNDNANAARSSQSTQSAKTASTLRIRLAGSNPSPAVSGVSELSGRSNYLIGETTAWLTNVPNFEKVKYESVYPGVDLVYYGNQGRLEYDFIVAPGADARRIRLQFDGALGVRVDKRGDLIINTQVGEIRQQQPRAYQETTAGAREKVAARYRVRRDGSVGIEVGAHDSRRALVIDPVLIYSTFLGGSGAEQGLGLAVGPDGSAYVTGSTSSLDFPGPSPIQGGKDGFNDAFVLKLNPAGNALIYATYIGGNGDDISNAIAVDFNGNAYIAGLTGSGSFPRTAGVFQDAKDGALDAFVTKINPAGSALVYSTYLGGNSTDQIYSIAVDSLGAAYVAGSTNSINFTRFPVENRSGNPLLKSTDAAANWSGTSNGLTASIVNDIAVVGNTSLIYAGTNLGVYKSADGGSSWQLTGAVRTSTAPQSTRAVVVDPSNPNIIYAATSGGSGLYKSTDGGNLYEVKNSGISIPSVNTLVIDPSVPTTLYAGTVSGIYKTTNGGDTWAEVRGGITGSSPNVNKLAIDPTNPQIVYAGTSGRGIFKTTNGGASWTAINAGFGSANGQIITLALNPSQPSTLFAQATGVSTNGVYKSLDGGANWTLSSNGLTGTSGGQSFSVTVNALLFDPSAPSTVYAGTTAFGVFKTTDGGANWTASNNGLTNKFVLALAARINGGQTSILAGTNIGNDGFVAKFNPSGSQLEYLRLLGGSESDDARGIAIDSTGSAYVTGPTASTNFPLANAFQPAPGGFTDAYLTKLSPAGDAFVYSTYLGGSDNDSARAIAVGSDGSAYITGSTQSANFPLANALQPTYGSPSFGSDAFIAKFAANGQSLSYSTYLGGDATDQGFAIAIGADGSAYVAGITSSSIFPLVNPLSGWAGGNDAFVAKLNPAGSALLFSTYLGGFSSDQGNAVAVDAAGNIYLVGNTSSSNFPLANALRGTYGGGTDAFIAKLGSSIELSLTMTDAPDPVALGSQLTYTIEVKNSGELTATGVVLTDTLPAGATFVSATPGQGSCSGTSTVVCNLGSLSSGASTTVNIVITAPATRNISNTASVTSNEIDPVPSNNTATQTTQVNFADLSVTSATAYNKVAPGSRINYLFRVKNNSGGPADSATLTDNLPAGTTFVSCNAVGGVCSGSGNNPTVTFTSLAVGQSATVVIVATVNPTVSEGAVLSNTATVASAVPDPNPGDNASTASVTVTATPLRQKTNGLVAYSTDRIYTARADASEAPTLFPGLSSAYVPRWSPDGARLAFIVSKFRATFPNDLYYELQVANADGSGLLPLADNLADVSTNFRNWFSWSPDGTRLAYIGKDTFIYIANADGSGFAKLPNSPSQVRDIDWSADGSRFVISKDFGEIYVMNVDGSDLTKLVAYGTVPDGPTRYVGPRWSPDMSKILYVQVSNNYSDVFIINSDGTGARRLLNTDTSFAPAWSPDGAKVAFYQGTQVHVIDLDGSNDVTLASNEGCCNFGSISWQPLPTNTPLPPPAPLPQTFTISGHVTNDANSSPLYFVTITLSGTRNAVIHTKPEGAFEFVNLPAGGNYTITASNTTYSFTPASRVYNNLGANQTGADFVATYIPSNITGRITDTNGNPLSGIRVSSSGGFPQGNTFTDANGFYSFPNVQPFRSYFISPDPFLAYSFAPQYYSFPNLTTSQTANFVGTKLPSNIISGRVVEYGTGNGIAGIQVNLARDIYAVTETFTDANGNFSFGERPSNYQYSLSIFGHPTYDFEPRVDAPNPFAQIVIPNLTSNQNVTFIGTRRNTLQFTIATPSAGEGDGRAEVFVTRSGDTSTAATVNYSTANGTASQASDYTTAVGTLKWAAGDAASKSIKIILTDDAYVEGTETFTLTLDSPVGAQLGATKVATINITDNDPAPAASNPIDDARFFVRQNYADFLSREPDQGGLDYWTERITQCGASITCINFWRSAVSAAFFIELEFQNTGSFVYRLYKASYGTRPTYGQFTPDRARVVDSPNPEQSKQSFALLFVQRPAFTDRYAPTLNGAAFVDALLQTVQQSSQVDLTSQRDALLNAYNTAGGGDAGRATVLRQVADNQAYAQAEYNKAFVLMQYFGFLKRNPDEGGYQFWLNVVNNSVPNDPSGYRSMVCAFITSPEYQQRFSGVITRNDTVCAPQ
ncbi:MAG: hypothetical protein QOF02_4050 [Blastocatellia bacterium]|jgi:uncharacterized repeat protein (TIGR01451 family)|nr:hypothetical protein [Blastocatellia bacterium]